MTEEQIQFLRKSAGLTGNPPIRTLPPIGGDVNSMIAQLESKVQTTPAPAPKVYPLQEELSKTTEKIGSQLDDSSFAQKIALGGTVPLRYAGAVVRGVGRVLAEPI